MQRPATAGLHHDCRAVLYKSLTCLLAPLLAGLCGASMGLLIFLQVWLVRPLVVAITMQAKLLQRCCSVILSDAVVFPIVTVWQVLLSTWQLDLATLKSILTSVFTTKSHSATFELPLAGAGRSSRTRYPGQTTAKLPFYRTHRKPKEVDPLQVLRDGVRMAADHREWLAKVKVVDDALQLAMTRFDDREAMRAKLRKDMDSKTRKALEESEMKAAVATTAAALTLSKVEAVKPVPPVIEMKWIDEVIERPPKPIKQTGHQLWLKARKMALDVSHRRRPHSFMDQAKKMVFSQTVRKDKIIKVL